MRIMDWSSDVCSSDLRELRRSDTCARPCGTSSPGVAGSPGIEHRKIFGKAQPAQSKTPGARPGVLKTGGAEGNRTPDLYNAIVALSQLSYGPMGTTGCASKSAARRRGDRKSVVEGKRVTGRVDLGGRRIIKKKK